MQMQKPQKSTLLTKEAGDAQREWWIIDLENQVLGRAATRIATVLRGKHKPTYTPHVDSGDFVIVINASKAKLTGQKDQKKLYRWHTEFPGGLREAPAKEILAHDPEHAIQSAVWGMLPKGPLGRRLLKKMKVYAGAEHQHAAQQPKPLSL